MTQAKYYDVASGTWKPIIAGPAGPTGAVGPTGTQGNTGATGETGSSVPLLLSILYR